MPSPHGTPDIAAETADVVKTRRRGHRDEGRDRIEGRREHRPARRPKALGHDRLPLRRDRLERRRHDR